MFYGWQDSISYRNFLSHLFYSPKLSYKLIIILIKITMDLWICEKFVRLTLKFMKKSKKSKIVMKILKNKVGVLN